MTAAPNPVRRACRAGAGRSAAALLAAVVLLPGCAGGGDEDGREELRAWMEESGRGLRGAVRPVPEVRPYAVAQYLGGSADDPFRSARLELERQRVVRSSVQPDTGRRREPLEHHALDALRMVGVMSAAGQTQALVQVEGTLHQVRVGSRMGRDFGVVTRISENSILLKELVQDVQGEWVERARTLSLQEAGK